MGDDEYQREVGEGKQKQGKKNQEIKENEQEIRKSDGKYQREIEENEWEIRKHERDHERDIEKLEEKNQKLHEENQSLREKSQKLYEENQEIQQKLKKNGEIIATLFDLEDLVGDNQIKRFIKKLEQQPKNTLRMLSDVTEKAIQEAWGTLLVRSEGAVAKGHEGASALEAFMEKKGSKVSADDLNKALIAFKGYYGPEKFNSLIVDKVLSKQVTISEKLGTLTAKAKNKTPSFTAGYLQRKKASRGKSTYPGYGTDL